MNRILDQFGNPIAADRMQSIEAVREPRKIRARFDSQFTTDENRRHFAMADAMSVDASASWMVRRTLRMRNRYEFHNNSYYSGIADTVGNYVVGTGPRLQMLTDNKKLNKLIEKRWAEWAKEINLAETLKTSRVARIYNGESFQLLRTNPGLDCPVKLDVFEIEADQVSSPLFGMYPSQYPDQFFDGIVLDPWGKPSEYHVLRQHPGAFGAFVMMGYEFDRWPARYVIHDYKRFRPGQQRGIPEANPALPLFAFLRQYTLAVIGAAESVADFAMVAQTSAPPDETDTFAQPMAAVELQRRMMTFLPEGYTLSQTKAEQPTTTYDMFVNAVLREISRCLNMPVFFASLDATKANMSSAYVITQPFVKSVQCDRAGYDRKLDHILDEWLTEAIRIPGYIVGAPAEFPAEAPHQWFWPSIGTHADPAKVANAQEKELANGTTSIPREYAKHGLDWESEQESAAKALGITLKEYREMLREKMFAYVGQPTVAEPGDEDPEASPSGTDPNSDDEDATEDDD